MNETQELADEWTTLPNGCRVLNSPQYSFSWWQSRRGIPTCSEFSRIISPVKGEPSKSQDEYIAELIADRSEFMAPFIPPEDAYQNAEMAEGTRREPESRSWYAMQTDSEIRQVGFVLSACGRFGGSPDALVGDDGILELKNPARKTQIKYLLKGGLPADYKCQVHGLLIVTQRKWVDFLSYCPGFAPLLVRIEPDEFTAKLRKELAAFCDRLQETIARVSAL